MSDQPCPSRRAFLVMAVAGAAVAASVGASPPPPIIDTHQHLWNLDQFDLPWLAGNALLRRNYLAADYQAAVDGLGVAQAVYMEVAVKPEQREAEAQYIGGVCKRIEGLTRAAVIAGNPADERFRAYIDKFKANPAIKGVRCSLPTGASANETFVRNVQYLGQVGWRFDLLTDPTKLKDAAMLVKACPETRFVLDHCGNASTAFYASEDARRVPWEDGLATLADQKNTVCKISGVCEAGPRALATIDHAAPVVNRCLDRFGPERVIFAGNWPVCLISVTFKNWVEMLRAITSNRGEEFQRKLFHDNADAFYELS